MTSISVGTIDVYCIDPGAGEWSVLTLQRAHDTRCPTAWETVHGHIETGESPEQAAVREVREETGLEVRRLYNTVELAVVFAAFVDRAHPIALGAEHMRHEWLTPDAARDRFVWPRERAALLEILHLLESGDAGPVEDVLRVL
jgi:dihydroneopterin triphosphate diphosphatase